MKQPKMMLKDIELVTEEEKNKLLKEFNQTAIKYDTSKTILDLWEEQVSLNAHKKAIICDNKQVSYQELEQLSNHFAAILQQEYKIKPGHNISILLNRSIDLIVAILAVLKCGCSYVLIDPEHPEDRRKYMIENSNSQFVISKVDFKEETLPYQRQEISSNTPMYLLYTSGSTGLPKAVTVTHRNFHNYVVGISRIVDYSGDKTVLSMASISFDVFGYELWVTLLNGLTLVLSTRRRTK